jgi:undecaprenyl pyrophosphate phosphatase UppP
MSDISAFCAAVAVSLGAALAVGWVLRRHLSRVLAELCGSRERGDFWMALASLCTLLAAAAASTFPYPPLFLNTILQCAFGLAGVLASLLLLAGALLLFIRRFEKCPRAPAPATTGVETPGRRDELLQRAPAPAEVDLDPAETLRRLRRRKRQCRTMEERL